MDDEHPEPGLRGRDLIGLGGMLSGSVVAGIVLGVLYDDHAHTSPNGVLVGVAIGVLVGIAGSVAVVRRALRG